MKDPPAISVQCSMRSPTTLTAALLATTALADASAVAEGGPTWPRVTKTRGSPMWPVTAMLGVRAWDDLALLSSRHRGPTRDLQFPDFYRIFTDFSDFLGRLHPRQTRLQTPEASKRSGSRRIEFSSKSTTFLMWQFLQRVLTRPLTRDLQFLPIFQDFSDFLGRLHPRQTRLQKPRNALGVEESSSPRRVLHFLCSNSSRSRMRAEL